MYIGRRKDQDQECTISGQRKTSFVQTDLTISEGHKKVDGIVERGPNWQLATELLVLAPTQSGSIILGKSLYIFYILKMKKTDKEYSNAQYYNFMI